MPVETECIAAAFAVCGAGYITAALGADAGLAAIGIFFTGASNDAAAIMADLGSGTLHIILTLRNTIAGDIAELALEAIGVHLAAVRGGAETVVTALRGTVFVGVAGGHLVNRHAVSAGGAELVIAAVFVDSAGFGADSCAADSILLTVVVDGAGGNARTSRP